MPVLESLVNKVLQVFRTPAQVLFVNIVKFLRAPILENICERLLLIILFHYWWRLQTHSAFTW